MLTEKISIYVPGTIDKDSPAGDVQLEQVRHIMASLSGLFGGATTIGGEGAWVDDEGELICEPVRIVSSFTDSATLREKRDNVYALCRQLCNDMSQDCVTLEIDGGMDFIDNKTSELESLISQLTK